MRLVKVKAPQGRGEDVARLALSVGVAQAGVYQQIAHKRDGAETVDVVDIETSTPTAKVFVEALMAAPYYDPHQVSYSLREARAIVGAEPPREVTRPFVEPTTDVLDELWQFSHLTPSFVGRSLVGAGLLTFGLVQSKVLFLLAGLLFLPILPLVLGIAFGLLTREWRLLVAAARTLLVGLGLLVLAGAALGMVLQPPMKVTDFGEVRSTLVASLAIGVAAGLATTDNAGWRQVLGLAAASQVALIPAWLGYALVHGLGSAGQEPAPTERLLALPASLACLILAAAVTYAAVRLRGDLLHRATVRARRPESSAAA
jgi:hypothetical protein